MEHTQNGNLSNQYPITPPFQALPRSQLLGSIDLDTREWTNGVLTVAALRAVEEPPEVTTWIVCDGDVDPEWVESLNSVLVGCKEGAVLSELCQGRQNTCNILDQDCCRNYWLGT